MTNCCAIEKLVITCFSDCSLSHIPNQLVLFQKYRDNIPIITCELLVGMVERNYAWVVLYTYLCGVHSRSNDHIKSLVICHHSCIELGQWQHLMSPVAKPAHNSVTCKANYTVLHCHLSPLCWWNAYLTLLEALGVRSKTVTPWVGDIVYCNVDSYRGG